MSIEIYAFSDRQLGSIAEWQAAIDADLFDVKLDSSRLFADLSGFLPVQVDGRQSGFECDHFDATEMIEDLIGQGFEFNRPWKYLLAFRFGGDQYECTSASLAAASYVRATDGVLFDGEEGEFYPPQGVLEYARKAADPAVWAELARILAR